MENWEDYYEILGISPDSSAEEIKEAYRYKVNILHPDRLMGAPESVRRRAEEDLKKVNRAYEILGDLEKRQGYHSEWVKRGARPKETFVPKPKPTVNPPHIRFDDVEPGEIKRASFIIRNLGDPYAKIWFSNPDSWVRVVRWTSLTTSDELPLEVEIEAEGEDWGKSYLENIRVKLDEEETQVRIELQTKPEPAREKVAVGGIPKARPSAPPPLSTGHGFSSWGKWLLGFALLGLITGLTGIFLTSDMPPETTTNGSTSVPGSSPEKDNNQPPVSSIYRWDGTTYVSAETGAVGGNDEGQQWVGSDFTVYLYGLDHDGTLVGYEYVTYDNTKNETVTYRVRELKEPGKTNAMIPLHITVGPGKDFPSRGENACTLYVRVQDDDDAWSEWVVAVYHVSY